MRSRRWVGWWLGCALLISSARAEEPPVSPELAAPKAARVGIVDESGALKLNKRDMSCPGDERATGRLRGTLLEPGREINPAPDTLQSIVQGRDRSFVAVAGTTMLSGGLFRGGTDILVAGLDNDFAPRWATVFGGPATDFPVSIAPTADGGYVVISYTTSLWYATIWRWLAKGNQAGLLSKYGPDGALQWVQYLTPGEEPGGWSVIAPTGGGILVGGGAVRGARHAGFLLRLTDSGELQWAREIGSHHEDSIAHLEALRDGGVLVSGTFRSSKGAGYEAWAGKFGQDGKFDWARSYSSKVGGTTGIAFPVADGGAVIVRSPEHQRSPPRSRVVAIAIAADGAVRWARVFAFDERVTISNFAETASGEYLLFGGAMDGDDGAAGPMVLKLGSTGSVVSSRAVNLAQLVPADDLTTATGDEPVSVVRDHGPGFIIMSNLIRAPSDLLARLKSGGSTSNLSSEVRASIRGHVYFLRLEGDSPTGPCARDLKLASDELQVDVQAIDMPVRDLPSNLFTPVPGHNIGFKRLGP